MDRVEELLQRKSEILIGGGKDSLNMQHNLNKLTARERIEQLVDENSFIEIGGFIGKNSAGCITGYGTVQGRLVYVVSQDYSVKGGAINGHNTRKTVNILRMALKMGAPVIQIFDSVGIDTSEDLEALRYYGELIKENSKLSGVVPNIGVIAGPCTGTLAILASMCDFTILSEKSGEFYVNDTLKLANTSGKFVEYKNYASPEFSSQNGSIKLTSEDDKDAMIMVRKLLSYIPSNNLGFPPRDHIGEEAVSPIFDNMVKTDSINVEEIIRELGDLDSFIELGKNFGDSVTIAFIKINGLNTGILGLNKKNTPLNIKAIEKVTGFIKICDSFNIPLITVAKDITSFGVNAEEEKAGLALSLSKLLYTLSEAVIPKVSLLVGKTQGTGYITFCSKESACDMVLAWPTASITLASSEAKETESIYKAAEVGLIDDIIIPSESKGRLYMALDMLSTKREIKYPKKHGSTLI
ncbi:propionyl-CoA carboxylase carboxyltransferase subunit [Clostridium amylolyticum]|uniref:Propionyl-CoA carboxylase carboxyltransferase subunit n=1 Tax=Clostridium amylolyticum TaxID=1121298 RepID=A0A1M6LGT3_9CLOT|nr:carboxyl transferase domain-containing protein [Clostridium amylolyticum]SHJ70338.1 propionyl-CoA carboxylase carboxyltransferase subunit [Clostridium amylolyticum]